MNQEQFIVELRTHIARNFIKQIKYAEEIGVSRSFLSQVLLGKKRPNKRMLSDLNLTMKKVTTITFESVEKIVDDKNRLVEVCDECGRSCCWHGELMCNESAWASTTKKTVEELDASALEHEYYYSKEVIKKVHGEEAPHGYRV